MPITTTGTLPAPVQQTFNQMILSTPVPNYIHRIPAMREHMPANGGRVMRFRRYNPLNSALVPLGNTGVTPPSQNLTAVDIDAEISFYGTYVEINEQVSLQSQDPVLNNASIRLGDSLRRTEDELTRNMLAGTAAFQNCVGGLNGNVPSNITTDNVARVTRTLVGNDGHMFLSTIEGEDKFDTAPIRNAYFALCHTDLTSDLESMPSFIPAARYPNQQNIIDSEWGSSRNLRFLVSSIGSVTPNAGMIPNTDIYNIFCVAKEAYATIEQDRYTAQFIYLPAQFSGALAQNVTAGYKFASAYRILNDAWVVNLRATLA